MRFHDTHVATNKITHAHTHTKFSIFSLARRYDDFSNETDAKLITTPYPVVSIVSTIVGYQSLGANDVFAASHSGHGDTPKRYNMIELVSNVFLFIHGKLARRLTAWYFGWESTH